MVLAGKEAVHHWKNIIGPSDLDKAKAENPEWWVMSSSLLFAIGRSAQSHSGIIRYMKAVDVSELIYVMACWMKLFFWPLFFHLGKFWLKGGNNPWFYVSFSI